MQRFVTLLTLGLVMASPAWAQMLDRTRGDDADVIWARDVGDATITFDGVLSEPEWAQAETLDIQWNDPLGFPGSGQFYENNPFGFEEPSDPIDATIAFLRKGNDLYVGVRAQDRSIGGSSGLWNIDGLLMTTINKNNRPTDFSTINNNFASTRQELFFSWWNRGRGQDTTATGDPIPGISPFFYSQRYGSAYASPDSMRLGTTAVDYGFTIDGVSNDDFNGNAERTPDAGYTLEFKINVDSLGWDLTQAMSRMPLTAAIQDADYNWPQDPDRFVTTRAWWQGQWANTLSQGTGYIAGDPSVTVSSGATPAYSVPEFTVPFAPNVPAPTIDGQLDEAVWGLVEPQFTLKYKATPEELDEGLPGVLAPYYSFYFKPGPAEIAAVDPTEGRFKMFYRGSTLYIGLSTDDQAVSGQAGEGRRDGFRFIIRSRDSTTSTGQADQLPFAFSVDSTGTARVDEVPAEVEVGTDLRVGAYLNPGSTAGDATNIDFGYQMEVALDLTSLGYDLDDGDREIWVSYLFFDGDDLLDETQSYGTRTWSMGERVNGASIMGYLDANTLLSTAGEVAPDGALRFVGSFPNPTTGTATMRYELAQASEVTVEVFDVLGRQVQRVEAGVQPAGTREATVDGRALSAGTYVVRVRLADGTNVTGRMLIAR